MLDQFPWLCSNLDSIKLLGCWATWTNDIHLIGLPWLSGYRVAMIFGTVMVALDGRVSPTCIFELLEALKAEARDLGANSVTCVEMTIDPCRPDLPRGWARYRVSGSACIHESLFSDQDSWLNICP